MLALFKNGITSVVLRMKILDATQTYPKGLTGLTSASSGLIISTIANNEAAATAYTAAGSTIETIATLGTFAAPTATKCRFKEVDATNHPGLYEIQIADARWAVSNARSVVVTASGVTGMVATDALIQLTNVGAEIDVNTAKVGGTTQTARDLGLALPAVAPGATGGLILQPKAGTAQSASTSVIRLAAGYTGDPTGMSILVDSNAGMENRIIDSWDPVNLDATLVPPLANSPTGTVTYKLTPFGARVVADPVEDADLTPIIDAINDIPAAIWNYVMDGTRTAAQLMRGWAAVMLGKSSNSGGHRKYRNIADTKDVVDSTCSGGDRTANTLDLD
jgi:hypothetical protein